MMVGTSKWCPAAMLEHTYLSKSTNYNIKKINKSAVENYLKFIKFIKFEYRL